MGSETVKNYDTPKGKVEVVGCWDGETPEGRYDFYDVFLNGECMTLGEPFYTVPTQKQVETLIH